LPIPYAHTQIYKAKKDMVNENKDLTVVEKFKEQLNTPKTYEQFVLEQNLTEQ